MKEPRVVHLAHGNEIVVTCGCGREIRHRRGPEGDRARIKCGACGFDTIYIWPPRPKGSSHGN